MTTLPMKPQKVRKAVALEDNYCPPDFPLMVCCGVGVDSVAMLVEMWNRGIRPDLVIFSDVGAEHPETYAYIPVLREWLRAVSFPDLVVVESPNADLEETCLKNGSLPSLAYGWKTCSLRFKKQPQDKYCNNWDVAREAWKSGRKVVKAVGFDASPCDSKRAKPAAAFDGDAKKYHNWYPLIEWGITRDDCVGIIAAAGLPVPRKSSCFFCPSYKLQEIKVLRRDHPDLLGRALAIEDGARAKGVSGDVKGLGRDYTWRSVVNEMDCQQGLW